MPLDETLPTYYFKPDREEPLRTEVCFSQFSSIPEPKYAKQHLLDIPNTYGFILHDSAFASVVFAEVRAALEPLTVDQQKVRRGSTDATDGLSRFQVPRSVRLTLLNPDYHASLAQHSPTGPFSSPYWEFSLPKEAFHQPTGSLLDAGSPPKTEYAVFRWKKEGVISPVLRCTYCPNPIPGKGKRGADEPDITVAIFSGWSDGAGKVQAKGELTVFEPNQRRLELQDWKGLEIALVASARAVADIWFSKDVRETFRVNESLAPRQERMIRPPGQSANTLPVALGNGRIAQGNHYGPAPIPPNNNRPYHGAPAMPLPPRLPAPKPPTDRKAKQQAAERAKQEAASQAEARRLQAIFEAEDRERQRAVEKETERIRREYEKERLALEKKQRRSAEKRAATQPAPQRPYTQAIPQRPVQPQRPIQPQRPLQPQTLSVPGAHATRKKSFWGLNLGGGGSSTVQGGYLSPPPPPANKLGKRRSFFW